MKVEHPRVEGGALSSVLGSALTVLYGVCILFVLVWLSYSVVRLGSGEAALVSRFGAPQRILESGTHWAWPYPFETVLRLPLSKTITVQTRLISAQPVLDPLAPPPELNILKDHFLIASDGMILFVPKATLQCRLKSDDPQSVIRLLSLSEDEYDFLGNLQRRGYEKILQHLFEQGMVQSMARFPGERALLEPEAFNALMTEEMRLRLEPLGLEPENVMISLELPFQYADICDRALSARNRPPVESSLPELAKIRDAAELQRAKILETARFKASALKVSAALSAERFKNLLPRYRQNPKTAKRMLRTQTEAFLYAHAEERFFITPAVEKIRLRLEREGGIIQPFKEGETL